MKKYMVCLLMSLLSAFLMAACSGSGGLTMADKNVLLSQRLDSYIIARQKTDIKKMRQIYLEPEKVRATTITVKESTIVSIKIADDGLHAETRLLNKIQVMGFTFAKIPTLINWVWSDNNWFIEMQESSRYPFAKPKSNSSSKSTAPIEEQK